jgi:hypothetical protein
MALPGMGGMGRSQQAGVDAEQLQQMQMVKYVGPWKDTCK